VRNLDNRRILLDRMDHAFRYLCEESEKLSVLLAQNRDPSSWTFYKELMRQRTTEIVAYEKYRKIQDELFTLIPEPKEEIRHESSVA
jgi:hypothetical protein